jgi:hypothetical protein
MTNFLKTNFIPKYKRVLEGADLDEVFTFIDKWMFYDELEKVGVVNFSKEQKQVVWNQVRLNLNWWKNERKPKKEDVIRKAKSVLFTKWINDKIESLVGDDEVLNK